MLPKHAVRRSLLAASAVFVAACQDSSAPVAPPDLSPSLSRQAAAQRAAAAFDRASAEVLSLPGTVFADYDEINGRLVFGVENAAAIRGVQTALSYLGLASPTYVIQVTEPIVFAATLREAFRPTQGGIQIHFSNFLCTMGFNVSHAGGRSFITNSHCTNVQGGVEGTRYFQPVSSVDPTVIATEAADPTYFTTRGSDRTCPRHRRCRYSDASRALYSATVASTQGAIAKTAAPNTGSLDVVGSFSVTSQNNTTSSFPLGIQVNKVGRTTGWTQGNITNTCVNTNVSGTNITQLCQTFVSAGVGGGDSGSPVFRIISGDNVELIGILWGGSGSTTYVFSPLKQIQQELGTVVATAPSSP